MKVFFSVSATMQCGKHCDLSRRWKNISYTYLQKQMVFNR